MRTKHLAAIVLDLLAPRSCVFCGTACEADEASICKPCADDLPWRPEPRLPIHGVLETSIAMLDYEFPIDVAIKRFKFARKLYYGNAFVEILMRALPLMPADIDAVVAVPLHRWRRLGRGFNQAEELAKPFAKRLRVPLLAGAARRRRTPPQSGLDAAERARNLRSAFELRATPCCRHVLIIDDVVTTGATLGEFARALHMAGIDRVSALCVAHAP